MELSEIENLWRETDKRLENSLRLNENLLRKINLDKAVGEFEKVMNTHILGRNMALVYCVISLVLSIRVLSEWIYSIPGLVAGFCMLWSFWYHLGYTKNLQNVDYYSTPVMDLQKRISEFRIRAIAAEKYDFSIVQLWFFTFIPLVFRVVLGSDLYARPQFGMWYGLAFVAATLLLFPLNQRMYRSVAKKLLAAEASLEEIADFERIADSQIPGTNAGRRN
jgi:hypothetical protein